MASSPAEAPTALGSVALVHDYLNQCGGAERVVLEMAKLWEDAPIHTTLYRRQSTFPGFADLDVRTSPLDALPVDAKFRRLFPLFPAAVRSLGLVDADVVISSSSGWAHAVRTTERALHVVYCYTPARWLHHHEPAAGPGLPGPVRNVFRRWDVHAARRPDVYVAISEVVRRRILQVYGRESVVVHPPVDLTRFAPSPRGERMLVVGRLLQRKRVDVVIAAAKRAGFGVDVVGDGPALEELRRSAGPTVTFHGLVPDATLTELYAQCRCVCLPCFEDFGLTPVEAHAAGKPAIAFADGGALETVTEGVTGAFFHEHTADSLLDALARCDAVDTSPESIAETAGRFSVAVFRERFERVVSAARAAEAHEPAKLVGLR